MSKTRWTSTKPSLTVELLSSYYPTVLSMQGYMAKILQSRGIGPLFLTHETDTMAYRTLLTTSYIASSSPSPEGKFNAITPMIPLRDLVERAQRVLLIRSKGKPGNVLIAGYRLNTSRMGENLKQAGNQPTLVNHFVNTIVTALDSPAWDTLFQRIGEDAMFHILTETCIFFRLPNDCFCQMAGIPIVLQKPPATIFGASLCSSLPPSNHGPSRSGRKRKRKTGETDPRERPTKRPKSQSLARGVTEIQALLLPERRTPADIPVARARMFYFRPYRIPHTALIVAGLPPTHVLNRLHPSKHFVPKNPSMAWTEPDPHQQSEHARHLAKYVFARQYNLPNPFEVSSTVAGIRELPDYSDREQQIKNIGPTKTPPRIKPVLPRLEQIIWHHAKCGYKALLQKVCPSKVRNEGNKRPDTSLILEMMSEHSIQLHSQAVILDTSISIGSARHSTSAVHHQAKQKPRFAEFVCSHTEVYRYTIVVTKAVIPFALWGSERNFKVICRHVKSFILARRFETLTLHRIMQDIATNDCEWLAPKNHSGRVCATDSLKRLELLQDFLFWYFDSFVTSLLRTTFYITESSAFRKQVLYFRQDDWDTLCAPLIKRLTTDTFQKLTEGEAIEVLRQRTLGFSFVRLLPKETGVRPIVNLRRKKPAMKNIYGRQEKSINQILQAAFQVLTYEKNAQKQLLGASVFGLTDIYTKLRSYKDRLQSLYPGGTMPKLYFVKLDVQACFDTIAQDKLLDILHQLISEDSYMIQRHGTVSVAVGSIKRSFVKRATPDDDHPHFLHYAGQLAGSLRSTIFVDQVVYSYAQKKEILDLLEEHITENIVKIGSDYYRQVVGIPQGSVLSTLLCSFFYGDLERKVLKISQDPQSVLLRLVDDYFLITSNKNKAQTFLDVMMKGHTEYGCFISKEKVLTNLDTEDIMHTVPPTQQTFPWCGHLINMSDLSVSVDYSRFHPTYLPDSLTVDTGRRAAANFRHRMLLFVKSKCHILFIDGGLNSSHVVFLNIYQNFFLVAMKMHYYLRAWEMDVLKCPHFVRGTIRQIILYAYAAMKTKPAHKAAKALSAQFNARKAHVLWLGTHAFHTVLSHKAYVYPQVLKALEFDMRLPQYRRFKRVFRAVTKSGLGMFALLGF